MGGPHADNREQEQRHAARVEQMAGGPGPSMTQEQLDTFLSMVAHDLRAPLQAISSFTEILIRQYETTFPEEAVNTLEMILESAYHAGSLIEALMRLSLATRHPLELETFDPAELVEPLAQELTSRYGGGAHIEINALPKCHADRTLLRQVFSNILENAFKFRREDVTLRIDVGGHAHDHEQHFWLRDNGPGIPADVRQRLFLPFVRGKCHASTDGHQSTGVEGTQQRLHHGGNGVGLAIVQRVVERHGGRAWVETPPEGGSLFHFTLRARADTGKPAGQRPDTAAR